MAAMITATPAKTAEWESRETPVVTMATTTATRSAYTLAVVVAMATAAKMVEWVWRPTPGPFRKSRGALMALVKQLPQLRPLGF